LDRRNFFKRLGIFAGAAVVVPTVFAETKVPTKVPSFEHDDLFTYLPMGNKMNFHFDKLTYPKISFNFIKKRMGAEGHGRFTMHHLYTQVVEEFDTNLDYDCELPITAITPTNFRLLNNWDFDFDRNRLCGGSWDYDEHHYNKDLAVVNVYGIGTVDPEYIQFKYCYPSYIDKNSMYPWRPLGNGIIYETNDAWPYFFDRGIVVDKTKETKIIIGAFNSNNEMLDVFMQRFKGFPFRAIYPFAVHLPISKHQSKWVKNKYKDIING